MCLPVIVQLLNSVRDVVPAPAYKFSEKLTLAPYKKIYAVNDSIVLQFQTADKRLYDLLSGTSVATDTSQLNVGFYINRRYPIGNQSEFFCEARAENPVDFSFTTLYTWYNILTYSPSCQLLVIATYELAG